MKKSLLFLGAASVALLVACGGGGGEEAAAPAAAPKAAAAATVDPATAGTINGKVMLTGDAPEMDVIQMGADPNCARLHDNPVMNEFVITGEGGSLANVFVHIKSGLSGSFPPPSEPVVLDQVGCVYTPHVVGPPGRPGPSRSSTATRPSTTSTPCRRRTRSSTWASRSRVSAPRRCSTWPRS